MKEGSRSLFGHNAHILAAGIFDSIDGKLARIMGISTDFGKEIDSLADMVSFCLAPAF